MEKVSRAKNTYWYIILFILATLVPFVVIFNLPESRMLTVASAVVRYNNPIFILCISVLLLAAFAVRDARVSNILFAVVLFTAFALALNGLWETMYTERNVIAGILPRRDAFSFYGSAMALLEKGVMVGNSTRRPLFGSFLAALLWIFDKNLPITLIAVAYLSALAVYFSTLEVRKSFNQLSALIYFIPQFLYYRKYIGNMMSETLGFVLGVIALTCFLRYYRIGASQKNVPPDLVLGVLCFTLSQLVRPGAIATLPLLAFIPAVVRDGEKRIPWRVVILIAVVIAAAFLVDSGLFSLLSSPNATYNSNAFNGLYAVVKGGKFWWQLQRDHPEVLSLDAAVRTQRTIGIILEAFFRQPLDFVRGMGYQFSVIFSLNPVNTYNVYSFMLSNDPFVDTILIALYYGLSLVGIVSVFAKIKQPAYKPGAILLLGFLCSLPIAPAYHEQYMRFYAGTIPLLGFLPAIGDLEIFKFAFGKTKLQKFITPAKEKDGLFILHRVFVIALIVFMVAAPILVKLSAPTAPAVGTACPDGLVETLVPYYPGSEVNINTNDHTRLPDISEGKFKLGIHAIPSSYDIAGFEAVPLPAALFPTIDLLSDRLLYVVVDAGDVPGEAIRLQLCGAMDERVGASFYYKESVLD